MYININYAIAIYNDDYTGINDVEHGEIKEFLKELKGYIHFDFDDTNFVKCDISGYGGECVRCWID